MRKTSCQMVKIKIEFFCFVTPWVGALTMVTQSGEPEMHSSILKRMFGKSESPKWISIRFTAIRPQQSLAHRRGASPTSPITDFNQLESF
jgi:hypothetical protein